MNIEKQTLNGSPFIGVFSTVTEKMSLIPLNTERKKAKHFEDVLGVETIPTSIASTSLLGVMARGIGSKFLVPQTIEAREETHLQRLGIEVHKVKEVTAIGNLVAGNAFGLLASKSIPVQAVKEMEGFLKVPIIHANLAGTELVGSSLVVNQQGFLVHPRAAPEEIKKLEALFKVDGIPTTANYGDPFVGNSLVATSQGALVGEMTSGPEMIRIDDGLSGGGT
ncbi:MAG: translation initiation factor IF-6 [Candidatus Diapherotrites archaeon]|nr:translation initiation factor IF-6 [Candidatus Diapherotrites archaeon]